MNDYTRINFAKLWAGKRGESSPIKLVGIRGAFAGTSPNRFAVYDDAILVMIDGKIDQWRASVDPSWTLVMHPVSGVDYAAQLCRGVHLFAVDVIHAGTSRAHLCLKQAEAVHVNRINKDGTVHHVDSGWFGIAIHSGGEGMDTGRFSAGCQIIQNPDGYFQNPTWEKFFGPIRDGMKAKKLSTVPYALVNVTDLPT